jgi:flagellar hook-basal body complex protein FliE
LIEQINFLPKPPAIPKLGSAAGAAQIAESFGSMLNSAIQSLNQQQAQVEHLNQQFIIGENSDAHALTIAAEKLSLGLEMTVQIRNKAVEAYQEIMRMQI